MTWWIWYENGRRQPILCLLSARAPSHESTKKTVPCRSCFLLRHRCHPWCPRNCRQSASVFPGIECVLLRCFEAKQRMSRSNTHLPLLQCENAVLPGQNYYPVVLEWGNGQNFIFECISKFAIVSAFFVSFSFDTYCHNTLLPRKALSRPSSDDWLTNIPISCKQCNVAGCSHPASMSFLYKATVYIVYNRLSTNGISRWWLAAKRRHVFSQIRCMLVGENSLNIDCRFW